MLPRRREGMSMARNTDFDPPSGTTGAVVRWIIVGAVAVVVVGGLAWGYLLATMPGRSATGVLERTLNPDNVIATYERFHDRAKGFNARLAQARETGRLRAAETDPQERSRLGIEERAQRQSCREIAAGYNADAAKSNREVFRGREAPPELDERECER